MTVPSPESRGMERLSPGRIGIIIVRARRGGGACPTLGTLRHCWACLYRDVSLSSSSQDVQSVPLVTNVLCKCMIAMSSRELAKPDTWITEVYLGATPTHTFCSHTIA